MPLVVQRHIALVDLLLLSHERASSDQGCGAERGTTAGHAPAQSSGKTVPDLAGHASLDSLGGGLGCEDGGAREECLEVTLGNCRASLVTGRNGLCIRSRVASFQSRGLGLDVSWCSGGASARKVEQGNAEGANGKETGWGRAAIDIEYRSIPSTAQPNLSDAAHQSTTSGTVPARVDGHASDERLHGVRDTQSAGGVLQTLLKLARNQSQLRVSLGGGEMQSCAVTALPLVRALIRSRQAAGILEARSRRRERPTKHTEAPRQDLTASNQNHSALLDGPAQCVSSANSSESAAALIRGLQAEKAALIQRLYLLENSTLPGSGQRDGRDWHTSERRPEGRSPPPSPQHHSPHLGGVGNVTSGGQGEMRLRLQNASGAVIGKGWGGEMGRADTSGVGAGEGLPPDSCGYAHRSEPHPHATIPHSGAHLAASAQAYAPGHQPMSSFAGDGVHPHAQAHSQHLASLTAVAQVLLPRLLVLGTFQGLGPSVTLVLLFVGSTRARRSGSSVRATCVRHAIGLTPRQPVTACWYSLLLLAEAGEAPCDTLVSDALLHSVAIAAFTCSY